MKPCILVTNDDGIHFSVDLSSRVDRAKLRALLSDGAQAG